jgi:hypothetical protein
MRIRIRRLMLFGLLACLAALGMATGLLVWSATRGTVITRENAAKIQVGMTVGEVEAILGGPARSDATGPVEFEWDPDAVRLVNHKSGSRLLPPLSNLTERQASHEEKARPLAPHAALQTSFIA